MWNIWKTITKMFFMHFFFFLMIWTLNLRCHFFFSDWRHQKQINEKELQWQAEKKIETFNKGSHFSMWPPQSNLLLHSIVVANCESFGRQTEQKKTRNRFHQNCNRNKHELDFSFHGWRFFKYFFNCIKLVLIFGTFGKKI